MLKIKSSHLLYEMAVKFIVRVYPAVKAIVNQTQAINIKYGGP